MADIEYSRFAWMNTAELAELRKQVEQGYGVTMWTIAAAVELAEIATCAADPVSAEWLGCRSTCSRSSMRTSEEGCAMAGEIGT